MTTTSSSKGFERQSIATCHDEDYKNSSNEHDAIYNPSKKVRQEEEEEEKDLSKNSSKISQSEDSIIKKEVILPDPKQDVDPDVFLSQLVEAQCGFIPTTRAGLDMNDFFPQVTEEQIAAYDIALVVACRSDDLETLRSLHAGGKSMNACNRFGESLLHIACRRGFVDMVQFLLDTCGLSVRILDDCGRTPLHDACWNPTPQLEICKWLIERDPSLLLVKDKRGSTPFQYARPEDWPTWRQFLLDHYQCLDGLDDDIFS
jgi:hypothetical protein